MKTTFIFDADGTLYDSGNSIKKCANIALKTLGKKEIPYDEMDFFIGPPLETSFLQCGLNEKESKEACSIYRKHYEAGVMFEIDLYPGIRSLLEDLEKVSELYIATSKPAKFAIPIAERIGISSYFKGVYGAFDDGSGNNKKSILSRLLANLSSTQDIYMIGDTAYDVLAGKEYSLHTVGVSYGYGRTKELQECHPEVLVSNVEELTNYLKSRL